MITSEYIKSLHVTDDEKEELSHTYRGLIILDSLIGNRVKGEGKPLSHAVSGIDTLKKVILTLIIDK
jgi:hypothetical protein